MDFFFTNSYHLVLLEV